MAKQKKVAWNMLLQEERAETSGVSEEQIGDNPFAEGNRGRNGVQKDDNREDNRRNREAVENRDRLLQLNRGSINDILYLHPNDHAGIQLVGAPLTGNNFYAWSRSIRRALGARNKLDFINGDLPEPEPESPYYKAWLKADYMVNTWIINSISKELASAFQYIEDSKSLWDEIKQRFDRSSGPKIYRIRRELSAYTQGNQSVMVYFNHLNAFWDELNLLKSHRVCTCAMCVCGAEEKLMQFLLGLNDSFETVRSQILLQEPLPTVNRAYSMVLQDEDQRLVTMRSSHQGEESAMYANNKMSREEKKKLRCIHCNKSGHEIQNCFELNGYPDWFKRLKDSRGKEDLYYATQSGEDINLKGNVSKLIQEEVAKCFAQYQPKKRLTGEDDNVNMVQANDNSFCRVDEHHAFSIIDNLPTDDLIIDSEANRAHSNVVTQPKKLAAEDWHRLLGHVSVTTMKHIPGVSDLCNEEVCHRLATCEVCHRSEQCGNHFPILQKRADRPFVLVHGYVWGPYEGENISNTHFVLTLVEDHSRLVWTYLLSSKTQVVGILKSFIAMVKAQFDINILNFKFDSESAFDNASVKELFEEAGIIHQMNYVYNSQKNRVVERKHHTIMEIARALMLQSKLPNKFWPYSMLSATWIFNRVPHCFLDWKSPYSILFGKSASLEQFKPFGSLARAVHLSSQRKVLDSHNISYVMLGISGNQRAYLLYDLAGQKVITSRDVRCFEHVYPLDNPLMQSPSLTKLVPNTPFADVSHALSDVLYTPNTPFDVPYTTDISFDNPSIPVPTPLFEDTSSHGEILLSTADIFSESISYVDFDRGKRIVTPRTSVLLDNFAAHGSESCLPSDLGIEESTFPIDVIFKSIEWPGFMFKELEFLVKPLSDLFTKGYSRSCFRFLMGKMGLADLHRVHLEGGC